MTVASGLFDLRPRMSLDQLLSIAGKTNIYRSFYVTCFGGRSSPYTPPPPPRCFLPTSQASFQLLYTLPVSFPKHSGVPRLLASSSIPASSILWSFLPSQASLLLPVIPPALSFFLLCIPFSLSHLTTKLLFGLIPCPSFPSPIPTLL